MRRREGPSACVTSPRERVNHTAVSGHAAPVHTEGHPCPETTVEVIEGDFLGHPGTGAEVVLMGEICVAEVTAKTVPFPVQPGARSRSPNTGGSPCSLA